MNTINFEMYNTLFCFEIVFSMIRVMMSLQPCYNPKIQIWNEMHMTNIPCNQAIERYMKYDNCCTRCRLHSYQLLCYLNVVTLCNDWLNFGKDLWKKKNVRNPTRRGQRFLVLTILDAKYVKIFTHYRKSHRVIEHIE